MRVPAGAKGIIFSSILALLQVVRASDWTVETNSLQVKEPSHLQGIYDVAIGDFGVPLYGASLQGQLKYIPDNEKGCSAFKDADFEGSRTTFIALVMRGDCYFVEKAYNAEKAGASAILVMDDTDEQLLTMAAPEERPEIAKLREDISIPTALISKRDGQALKESLATSNVPIIVELDWSESMINPDDRVEWELWTSSNDGCGNSCDIQLRFKKEFAETAKKLEKAGNTLFTPHYMSRECTSGLESLDCKDNCLHYGRYCSMDTIGEQYKGRFKGWQVVEENKRQLCVFQQAKQKEKPWLWWDFVSNYGSHCTFANGKFNDMACAQSEVEAVGLNNSMVLDCMAWGFEDEPHDLMKADFEAQGRDMWGAKILLLPTVIMNENQYRGRLDTPSIVRGLCAGFKESSEPEICLAGGLQTNECIAETHDCWMEGTKSACVDTFRGFVCECPAGYEGDGHTCQDIDECADGSALCDQVCVNEAGGFRCECNPGYKLVGTRDYAICSAIDQCRDNNGGCEEDCHSSEGHAICSCGPGLRVAADGRSCTDIDECAEGTSGCQQGCENKDPRISEGIKFTCKCDDGYALNPVKMEECIQESQYLRMLGLKALASSSSFSWPIIAGIILASTLLAALSGIVVYRWRMQRQMQSEIHAIMRQYMPLDGDDDPDDDSAALQQTKDKIKAHLGDAQC